MKKIIALAVAVVMVLCLALSVAAYDKPVTIGLFIGDPDNGGWGSVDKVEVSEPGTYTLKYEGDAKHLDWIIVKNDAGENEPTSIPAGTVIKVTELKINGTAVSFDSGDTYEYEVPSATNVEIQLYLNPNFGGKDHIVGRPDSATSVEVTFVVDPDAAAPAPAPAEDTTPAPAEDTTPAPAPAEDTTPAPAPAPAETTNKAPATGLAIAVVPAIVAMAAVAVSKKR